MIDHLFLLAIGAIGWGLSLATYGPVARKYSWPAGLVHVDRPGVPALLGLGSFLVGLAYAGANGRVIGGIVALLCGGLLALFWTGFLRVGSQVSLVLAPIAAVLLALFWVGSIGG